MNIAILGAGMVGRTMALDLSKEHQVTSFDINPTSLEILSNKAPHVQTVVIDLSNFDSYNFFLTPFDFVITAVPGFMGYNTLKAVINAGKNVADISFFPEDALKLNEFAKEKKVTAIVDCGVAPGLSNYFIGYYNSIMNITNFECMVGGLPKQRILPWEYKAPFSPIDVIEEYTRPARIMENGKIVTKPALTEIEPIDLEPIGTLESFNTDGLRTILFTMGHIPNMKEKTLRYPGHAGLIKNLQKTGFFNDTSVNVNGFDISPLAFSSKILIDQWKLLPNEEEFTIMRMTITGTKDGKHQTIIVDLFDEYDPNTQLSSMSRTTGYTCTATLNLIMKGLFNEYGVFSPELIAKDELCIRFVLDYLEVCGVKINICEIEN